MPSCFNFDMIIFLDLDSRVYTILIKGGKLMPITEKVQKYYDEMFPEYDELLLLLKRGWMVIRDSL